jgi:hypothetical protein
VNGAQLREIPEARNKGIAVGKKKFKINIEGPTKRRMLPAKMGLFRKVEK